ncbi:hypothetical protein CDIK_3621, partial [Cucumispora dikerogammari]
VCLLYSRIPACLEGVKVWRFSETWKLEKLVCLLYSRISSCLKEVKIWRFSETWKSKHIVCRKEGINFFFTRSCFYFCCFGNLKEVPSFKNIKKIKRSNVDPAFYKVSKQIYEPSGLEKKRKLGN